MVGRVDSNGSENLDHGFIESIRRNEKVAVQVKPEWHLGLNRALGIPRSLLVSSGEKVDEGSGRDSPTKGTL